MKKLFAIMLAVTMMLGASLALADTVTMGTNASFAPFEYVDDDGSFAGFDVEIAQLLAAELGMELVIEDIYFDGLIAALDAGTVDFVMAGMTITEERLEAALCTTPYLSATQVVIVMEDNDSIAALEDIADKKVAVQDGTTGLFMALDTIGVPESNVSAFKASPDAILELTTGRADCVIIDDAVAKNFVDTYDGLKILDIEMPLEEYGIFVKMGNDEMLDALNAALEKIMENGSFDEVYNKYFG